jgi:hypothetical protein
MLIYGFMVEFNPDGSIKLPSFLSRKLEDNKDKLTRQRCILIRKEVVSGDAPKKCTLHITISDAITDNRFIENIYLNFKKHANVPLNLRKVDEKHFDIDVGTNFKRCTDCNTLIARFREFLDGNIIENKGSCTFEGRKDFLYEDYFG